MLKLAIVGAGVMGANHIRVARGLLDVEITHVVDPDRERAEAAASACGAQPTDQLSDLDGAVDAAVLASPSEQHAEHAKLLLGYGLDLLIEKPLATTIQDAADVVKAAETAGAILQVGHVERFNPAVLELDNLLTDVVHIETVRISPYSPRAHGGVVIDLMIHDLDLALALSKSSVSELYATTQRIHTDAADLANVLIRFENGVTANLTASRVGQNKIRTMSITQRENFVAVDLLRQDVTIHRVDMSEYLSEEGARYRQTGVVELPFLEHRGEPLYLELAHFVACVQQRTPPRVSGQDGLRALDLALQVEELSGRC